MARSFCTRSLLTHFPIPELNPYDIRQPCATPPLCYDFSPIESFLATPAVRQVRTTTHSMLAWVRTVLRQAVRLCCRIKSTPVFPLILHVHVLCVPCRR